jgi:hypothetical protein
MDLPEPCIALRVALKRRRLLPGKGEVLVSAGERVTADQVVAEGPARAGLETVDIAGQLGVSPARSLDLLSVRTGQEIHDGEVLAEVRERLRSRRQVLAPTAGRALAYADGRLYVRREPEMVSLIAHLPGIVEDVLPERGVAIAAVCDLVRGVWGAGGETHGRVLTLCAEADDVLSAEAFNPGASGSRAAGDKARGCILWVSHIAGVDALMAAVVVGAAGLIVGSVAPDLLDALERLPVPIILTEGVGRLPLPAPLLDLALFADGRMAALSGVNHDAAAGPELVLPYEEHTEARTVAVPAGVVGALVRLTRDPHEGVVARVLSERTTASEGAEKVEANAAGTDRTNATLAYADLDPITDRVEVRLPSGQRAIVPLANVEILSWPDEGLPRP